LRDGETVKRSNNAGFTNMKKLLLLHIALIVAAALVLQAQTIVGGNAKVGGSGVLGVNSGGSCTAGGSTPTIVQHAGIGGMTHAGASTTVTITTFSGNVTATDQLFVVGYCSTGSRTLTIADVSAGGSPPGPQTWVSMESNVSATPGPGEWSLWGVANALGCTGACVDTVTVTASGSCSDFNAGIVETTNTSTTVDQGTGAASGLNSSNVTTLFANELALGILVGGNGGTVGVQGSGFTLFGNTNAGGTNPGYEGQALSSCQTLNATWTAATGTLQSNIVTVEHN
jgi:hypothetical protein